MKILSNFDFRQNQLINAVVQKLAVPPTDPVPVKGQIYFNTAQDRLFYHNGLQWVGCDALDATMTGADIIDAINDDTTKKIDLDKLPAITKATVGLGSVTNDRQVKARATSTKGKIPAWDSTTGDALSDGYSVETVLTGSGTALPRADAVKDYIDTQISTAEAMVYKGTLGAGGTATTLPNLHSKGDTYKVITANTYLGHVCEVGDMVIAITDRTSGTSVSADWTVVQANIDGAVINSTGTSVKGNFVEYDGTNGKVIKDSGKKASDFATANHNHDGTYPKKYAANVGNGSLTAIEVTHNLNSRDVIVQLRENSGSYAQVYTTVEMTTVNKITLRFAVAPANNEYRVTVIG